MKSIFLFAAATLAFFSLPALADKTKPTVILIILDTVSGNHIKSLGYKYETTPFLDKLAARSANFENSQASAAYSFSSHHSLFTGLFPQTHRQIVPPLVLNPPVILNPKFLTMAQYFKNSGYATGWWGVMNTRELNLKSGLSRGFDELRPSAIDKIETPEANAEFRRQLKTYAKVPSFLFLHTYLAHDPYRPIPPYDRKFGPQHARKRWQTYDDYLALMKINHYKARETWTKQFHFGRASDLDHMRALYDGGLRHVDQNVKILFSVLEEEGFGDAIVVVTSDHGEVFGTHGEIFHSEPLRATLRVPLIIKIPGQKPVRISEPVFGVDLLPTVLELAGLKPESYVEGQSLVPLLKGEKFTRKNRISLASGAKSQSISDGEWKYLKRKLGDEYLFHLKEDPQELTDVSSKFPEQLMQLKTKLEAFELSRLGTEVKNPEYQEGPRKRYIFLPDGLGTLL